MRLRTSILSLFAILISCSTTKDGYQDIELIDHVSSIFSYLENSNPIKNYKYETKINELYYSPEFINVDLSRVNDYLNPYSGIHILSKEYFLQHLNQWYSINNSNYQKIQLMIEDIDFNHISTPYKGKNAFVLNNKVKFFQSLEQNKSTKSSIYKFSISRPYFSVDKTYFFTEIRGNLGPESTVHKLLIFKRTNSIYKCIHFMDYYLS